MALCKPKRIYDLDCLDIGFGVIPSKSFIALYVLFFLVSQQLRNVCCMLHRYDGLLNFYGMFSQCFLTFWEKILIAYKF